MDIYTITLHIPPGMPGR